MENPGYVVLYLAQAAFGFSLWGFGSLFLKERLHTLRVVLGMAIVSIFGGWLCYFNLATGTVLLLLFSVGMISALAFATKHIVKKEFHFGWFFGLFLATLVVFAVNSQGVLWPESFNNFDDYQKYFVHPVKLLQTGSPFGSPIATMGKEVLGGQAFFQAFYVHLIGLRAINLFDASFCLTLAVLMTIEFGREIRKPYLGVLAALLVLSIHSQYVNVSSLYSFSIYVMASILISLRIFAAEEESDSTKHFVALGLVYGGAMILKSGNAFLPLVHFPVLLVLYLISHDQYKAAFVKTILAVAAGVLVVSGWMAYPVGMYLKADTLTAFRQMPELAPQWEEMSQLFSFKKIYYGGNFLLYSVMVMIAITLGSYSALVRKSLAALAGLAAAITVGVFWFFFMVMLSTETAGADRFLLKSAGLRYIIPVLIGIVPIIYVIFARDVLSIRSQVLAYVLLIFSIGMFMPVRFEYFQKASRCESALAFFGSCDSLYRDYSDFVLGGAAKNLVQSWQNNIPAGEAIAVWTNVPFLFDFERNPVVEIDLTGLTNPWATMPDVGYLIAQFNRFGSTDMVLMKQQAEREPLIDRQKYQAALSFVQYMENELVVDKLVYRDDDAAVYQLAPPERNKGWP